jgi:hypothetical protein
MSIKGFDSVHSQAANAITAKKRGLIAYVSTSSVFGFNKSM